MFQAQVYYICIKCIYIRQYHVIIRPKVIRIFFGERCTMFISVLTCILGSPVPGGTTWFKVGNSGKLKSLEAMQVILFWQKSKNPAAPRSR